jgi:proteic killer suppression protein
MVTSARQSAWPLDWPIENLASAGLRQPCLVRLKLYKRLKGCPATPWQGNSNHSAWRNYAGWMIRSFRCPDTERLAQGWAVPQFQAFERVARRKLRQLEIAGRLDDLRIPPGNRLEALRGDRSGQHSIRINGQFRLCFVWTEAGPEAVEIVDYH